MQALLACIFIAAGAFAQGNGTLRVSAYPNVGVADSRSSLTITAEIRDASGRPVPDGAPVLFQSTLGSFREDTVTTSNGYARAIFVAGSIPGTAHITVVCNAIGGISNFDLELLSDRNLLSSAREYAELVSAGNLLMSYDKLTLAASSPSQGVSVRFQGTSITADDLQIEPNKLEVKARKANLTFNGKTTYYSELEYNLKARNGYGVTLVQYKRPVAVTGAGKGFGVINEDAQRLGTVRVTSKGAEPLEGALPPDIFKFADLSQSLSEVSAKKALIYPNREVQFQKAELLVSGSRLMKMPLFQVKLDGGQTPIFGDSLVNIANNKPSINYPQYLSLKPGETSLLRFHTGDQYGRGFSTNNGAFLDYELNWNKGSDSEGGLVLGGLGRRDWTLSSHHFLKTGPSSSLNLLFDSPSARAAFASAGFTQGFHGYQTSLNLSSNRNLRGDKLVDQNASFIIEKDPVALGKLPIKMFLGATATSSQLTNNTDQLSQTTAGLRLRSQLDQQHINRATTFDSAVTFSKLAGHNSKSGLGIVGNMALRSRLTRRAFVSLGYDYVDDGLHSVLTGKQRLSAQASYSDGRVTMSGFASRGLDSVISNEQLDFSYNFAGLWRLGYSQTVDRYSQGNFFDYNAILSYRYGIREFGLTYSRRTNHFGFQLLGSSFN